MRNFFVLIFLFQLAACRTAGLTDVAIKAERSGYCDRWETQLSSTAAVQRVTDSCEGSPSYQQAFTVSSEDWTAIQDALFRSRFRNLPPHIYYQNEHGQLVTATHGDIFCLEVLIPAPPYEVCFDATAEEITPEASRFLDVWTEVTKVAPEPTRRNEMPSN